MHYYFYLHRSHRGAGVYQHCRLRAFAWAYVHKRMWHLCFRVGLLARDAQPPLHRALSTHPLPLFFFGRVKHLLHREITRLEDQHRVRKPHSRSAIARATSWAT